MIDEDDIRMLTNYQLSTALNQLGIKVGPITGSTRLVYERKLARLLADVSPVIPTPASEFNPSSYSTQYHYCRTMIPDVKAMTNDELSTALRNSGARVGPITDTTRLVYERKLVRLLQDLPPATSTDELEESENEEEEEETVSKSTVEEKTSERPRESSTKVTRSMSRRSRRDANPPPDDVSPDKPRTNQKKGKIPKLYSEVESSNLISESVKPPKKNAIQTKIPEPKSLPKSKLKSNIPLSAQSDISNSTMVYPHLKKLQEKRRSFGLGDSFQIHHETNAKELYSEEQANGRNFVPDYNENQEANETDSDESMDSSQELSSDTEFTSSPHNGNYDDQREDHYFTGKNPPVTNVEYSPRGYNFTQGTHSSETVYHANEPIRQPERFSSHIPRWSDDQQTSQVFKKPNAPTSSHVGQATNSKKSNSIWKLDPVEEQNIHREFNDARNGLSYSPSVKYDCLPKAFRDKYSKYMKVSGTDGPELKNRQSIDSLPFLAHQKQAKDTNSDSMGQVKAKKLTSAYQRFTSPLASKISSANPSTSTPSYIGTPGSSQLNTSLTRRPLSSMREEVKFTSLRNSEATSASAPPKKKGASIMVKLLVLIVLGVIAWLIYINFESAHTKPLLTTNQ